LDARAAASEPLVNEGTDNAAAEERNEYFQVI
jgi:hypothetical protein